MSFRTSSVAARKSARFLAVALLGGAAVTCASDAQGSKRSAKARNELRKARCKKEGSLILFQDNRFTAGRLSREIRGKRSEFGVRRSSGNYDSWGRFIDWPESKRCSASTRSLRVRIPTS